MAKNMPTAAMDAALDYIGANADKMIVCSAQPTTYTEANATYALADVAVAGGDFTKAAGDTSGRKVTVGAKTGVPVDTSGTATHIAFVKTGDSTLRGVTTCTSQAISTGGTVDIPSFKVWEIQQVT